MERDRGLGRGWRESRLVFLQLPPTLALLRPVLMTSGVVRGYHCGESQTFPSCTLPPQNVLGVHESPLPPPPIMRRSPRSGASPGADHGGRACRAAAVGVLGAGFAAAAASSLRFLRSAAATCLYCGVGGGADQLCGRRGLCQHVQVSSRASTALPLPLSSALHPRMPITVAYARCLLPTPAR